MQNYSILGNKLVTSRLQLKVEQHFNFFRNAKKNDIIIYLPV